MSRTYPGTPPFAASSSSIWPRLGRSKDSSRAPWVLREIRGEGQFDRQRPRQDPDDGPDLLGLLDCAAWLEGNPLHRRSFRRPRGRYDLVGLPSTNERFGYVIAEVLPAALRIPSSDRTSVYPQDRAPRGLSCPVWQGFWIVITN